MERRKRALEKMELNRFWQDRPVFVTGAAGLVGGWVVEKLIAYGADVIALIRDEVPRSRFYQEGLDLFVTTVRGDLSDPALLERILSEYEIESVIHLAAQTIVPIANHNPLSTFESNIRGTWNLLESCRHARSVQSIVVASSDKAYGECAELPYKETMPLRGLYPYDVSKTCADQIAQSYAATFDLPVAITRCGNFFGGGDLNWNRLIPGTIRSIIRDKRPLIRSDGSLIRDYIYVEDAASAYLTLSEHLAKHPSIRGTAYNFSNETQKTVLELTNLLLELFDSDLQPQVLGENHGEIPAQYLDSTLAKKELGWEPQFGLQEGLEKTIDWYQNYFKVEEHALSLV